MTLSGESFHAHFGYGTKLQEGWMSSRGMDAAELVTASLAAEVIRKCLSVEETLATAESCTGGLVVAQLTAIPGASQVVLGSIVAYTKEGKLRLLHMDETSLKEGGLVSPEVATLMAETVRELAGTHYGLAITGRVGPSTGDPGRDDPNRRLERFR